MNDNVSAYPLSWPQHIKRTRYPKHSRFSRTRRSYDGKSKFAAARDGIYDELAKLGAKNVIISSNIPLRQDGQPRASYKKPTDVGVAVYFTLHNEIKVIACDNWYRLVDNIHAIWLSIQAIRGLDRWACSDILKSAFAGFRALPESATPSSWRAILGVDPGEGFDVVKARYRHLVKIAVGEKLYILNDAYEAAKRELQ